MNPDPSFQEHLHQNVHSRLRWRFFIYLIVSVLMIGVVSFRIVKDQVSPLYPFIGFVGGAVIGIFITRVLNISWDHRTQKVITRLDIYGIVILIVYFIFEFFRLTVVGYFIHGPVVVATSLAVLAGIMIGRVVGIRGRILSVLEENL